MTETFEGLQVIHQLISCPTQWHLLLRLAAGPQSLPMLWRQLPGNHRWTGLRAIIGLWRHHLIVFHVKQGTWELSPTGQSLRPVFTAIETCTQNNPTGGSLK